jgi:hypothetical protein
MAASFTNFARIPGVKPGVQAACIAYIAIRFNPAAEM